MILMIRALAECDSPEAAAELAPRLLQATAQWLAVEPSPPERYWKMPELYEFTLVLAPPSDVTFAEVIASAPSGWTHSEPDDDRSSVWNREEGVVFLLPEVRWAEVLKHGGGSPTS